MRSHTFSPREVIIRPCDGILYCIDESVVRVVDCGGREPRDVIYDPPSDGTDCTVLTSRWSES